MVVTSGCSCPPLPPGAAVNALTMKDFPPHSHFLIYLMLICIHQLQIIALKIWQEHLAGTGCAVAVVTRAMGCCDNKQQLNN